MKKKDYFVSYNKNNKDWAKWIAGTLEENGYTVYLQAWDIVPGDDFISQMNVFLQCSKNCIAVLSRSYWKSEYCKKEFQTAFNAHLNEKIAKLIPVRVEDVSPSVLYNTIVYIDLFNLDEKQATTTLLQAVGHTKNPRKKGIFPLFGRPSHTETTFHDSSFPGSTYTQEPDAPLSNQATSIFDGLDDEILQSRLTRPSERE